MFWRRKGHWLLTCSWNYHMQLKQIPRLVLEMQWEVKWRSVKQYVRKYLSNKGGGVLPLLIHINSWLWNKPTVLPPQIHTCPPSIPKGRRAVADRSWFCVSLFKQLHFRLMLWKNSESAQLSQLLPDVGLWRQCVLGIPVTGESLCFPNDITYSQNLASSCQRTVSLPSVKTEVWICCHIILIWNNYIKPLVFIMWLSLTGWNRI